MKLSKVYQPLPNYNKASKTVSTKQTIASKRRIIPCSASSRLVSDLDNNGGNSNCLIANARPIVDVKPSNDNGIRLVANGKSCSTSEKLSSHHVPIKNNAVSMASAARMRRRRKVVAPDEKELVHQNDVDQICHNVQLPIKEEHLVKVGSTENELKL